MKPSIEETLVDWLGAQSLEVEKIEVETKWYEELDIKVLYKADGNFRPVGVDRYDDGSQIVLEYHQFTLIDPRFAGTKLTFTSDTKFQIR